VAILYIVANIALGIHLFHGTWSLFQSMGWNNPRVNQWRRGLATGVATIVVVGNASFPIMTLAGVIEFDESVPSVHTLHEASDEGAGE
jgi:succinate dehydrogenase / fumarate reductase cytochrome b subunit